MKAKYPAIKDGDRFSKWTVLSASCHKEYRIVSSLCRCDCGAETLVRNTNLNSGRSTMCNKCSAVETGIHRRAAPLEAGQRYGKWTVLETGKLGQGKKAKSLCRCDCGRTEKHIHDHHLRSGRSTMCFQCSGDRSNEARQHARNQLLVATGKFGKLRLLATKEELLQTDKTTRIACECDCGGSINASRYQLLSGAVRQCAKCAREEREALASGQAVPRKQAPTIKRNTDSYIEFEHVIRNLPPKGRVYIAAKLYAIDGVLV